MGMCKPSGGIKSQVGTIGSLKADSDPNTRIDLYNEQGELIQQRWYGPDGRAMWNRDWKHPDTNPRKPHKFPHDHPWDWNKKVPRLKYEVNRDINSDYC